MSNLADSLAADRVLTGEEDLWPFFGAMAKSEQVKVALTSGFSDDPADDVIKDAFLTTVEDPETFRVSESSGFPDGSGCPGLRTALAEFYSPGMGRLIDPAAEILIGTGAGDVLHLCGTALLGTGDRVLLMDPYFDKYRRMILKTGAAPVYSSLRTKRSPDGVMTSADFQLDWEDFAGKMKRSRMLILNTPNNPTGKVFSIEELRRIASLCVEHDVLCVTDEVYEFATVGESEHHKIAALPGMWDRCLTVGSAGKAFEITGFKVGWAVGGSGLVRRAAEVARIVELSPSVVTQRAVERIIRYELANRDSPRSLLGKLNLRLRRKRDIMCGILRGCGLDYVEPEGGWFVMVNIERLVPPELDTNGYDKTLVSRKDIHFAIAMAYRLGLLVFPGSMFFRNSEEATNWLRISFVKNSATLQRTYDMFSVLSKWV